MCPQVLKKLRSYYEKTWNHTLEETMMKEAAEKIASLNRAYEVAERCYALSDRGMPIAHQRSRLEYSTWSCKDENGRWCAHVIAFIPSFCGNQEAEQDSPSAPADGENTSHLLRYNAAKIDPAPDRLRLVALSEELVVSILFIVSFCRVQACVLRWQYASPYVLWCRVQVQAFVKCNISEGIEMYSDDARATYCMVPPIFSGRLCSPIGVPSATRPLGNRVPR
eukprot:scaffold173664_cov33-Tisochrysis_lutea.AAC.5